jgi:hypothetical protein
MMTDGKKGEALIGGISTIGDNAAYPWGCQMKSG